MHKKLLDQWTLEELIHDVGDVILASGNHRVVRGDVDIVEYCLFIPSEKSPDGMVFIRIETELWSNSATENTSIEELIEQDPVCIEAATYDGLVLQEVRPEVGFVRVALP